MNLERFAVIRWQPRGAYYGERDSVNTWYYLRRDSAEHKAAALQAEPGGSVATVVELVFPDPAGKPPIVQPELPPATASGLNHAGETPG